jgi:hypothetical protein
MVRAAMNISTFIGRILVIRRVRVDAELPESSFANRSGFKPPALLLKRDEVENLTQLLVEVGNCVGVRGSPIANQLPDR